jgi:hypothetical protein
VLASNTAALQLRHPGLTIAGEFAADSNLSNSGERVILNDRNGNPIADFTYQQSAPWPVGADGSGFSLVLINPLSDPVLSNPANWRVSISANGLPGLADADTFAAWAGRNGIAIDPLADTNLNGLSNLVDYALGSSTTPQVVTGQFETLDVGNGPEGFFVVRFRKYLGADDLLIVPQISPDMTNWVPLTELVSAEETPAPDGTVEVVYRSAQTVESGSRQYFRVEVSPRSS